MGLRMADHYNIKVIKKNSFSSGGPPAETWSDGSFYTTDNTLWINYAMRLQPLGGPNTYTESGAGDYQIYIYK